MPDDERRPGGFSNARPPLATKPDATDAALPRQVRPVGPHPDVATLLVGALLWGPDDAADVLELLNNEDVGDPALAVILGAVRALLGAGKPIGPQLVVDELRRTGRFAGLVPDRLRTATTSGAAPTSRPYAAAVVAEALRLKVESAGRSLTAEAETAAEADLVPMVVKQLAGIADCAQRLAALRGEAVAVGPRG